MIPLRFTEADAYRAYDEWGCNCGPGAIAAVMGLTLDELRPHLGDFEQQRYTNPTLMFDVLRRIGATFNKVCIETWSAWPLYGLVRVQWEGPWTADGVPMAARYRYTHWVGAQRAVGRADAGIFDINCMNSGGWVSEVDWAETIVPHLLQAYPRANGRWHRTHVIEVDRPKARAA